MKAAVRSCTVVELTGGAPEQGLNRLVQAGAAFWDIRWQDAVTVQITVYTAELDRVEQAAAQALCQVRPLETVHMGKKLSSLLRRPVLLLFLVLAVGAAAVLPQFVFFYEVQGNETVPAEQILRELEALGIGFGTYGPDIRPHWIKNRLLARIPELSWVTVAQNGCRAVVTVRERKRAEEPQPRRGCANVVAARSGVIEEMSVLAGQPVVRVGDTVLAGELLVSGVVDLERIWHLEYAQAEIFARTWRKNQAVIPVQYTGKGSWTEEKQCIWLIFGNQRIKIFGNSGISYGSCDKMIETLVWTLPGGAELPVRLEIEHLRTYTAERRMMEEAEARDILAAHLRTAALTQMQAGELLREQLHLTQADGLFRLDATLECREMIAETVPVKWENEDNNYDRTHSQRRENGADH